jgi:triacylglycerol lipase
MEPGVASRYQVGPGACGLLYQMAAGVEDTDPPTRHAQSSTGRTRGWEMSKPQPMRRQQDERVCGSRRRVELTAPLRVLGGARAAVQTVARAAMVQANEVAMLMSVAAMTPLRLVGGGFEPASSLSPHIKARPAPTTHPVLLVHGLGGTKSSWSVIAQTLSARGLTVDAIAYTPIGTSVEQLADQLVAEVKRILSRTGADKVHLVGHSLGGVVIAQAIADGGLNGLVDTVVTLGSPFGGSPWAGLLPFVEIVRALRPGSPLLQRLASASVPDGVRWLAVTAALDIIVPGMRSVPTHAQVETITVNGVGHLGMLLSRHVIGCITAALSAHESAAAADSSMRLLQRAS